LRIPGEKYLPLDAWRGMKFAAILLLAAAGLYAIGDAVLAPTPTPEHPGFVDAVLASRAVVAAIRLAIIFAGAFVIASVVALISQGRWLTRVGPVQVSEKIETVDAESQHLQRSLAISRETVDNLERDLAISNSMIDQMKRDAEGTE
jgi:hypothetical protein